VVSAAAVAISAPSLLDTNCEIYRRSGGGKSSTVDRATREDRRAGDSERSPGATVSSRGVAAQQFERRALIQFSARENLVGKLERVRSIASHRLPANAPLEQLVEFLADYFTDREDPAARQQRREARTKNETPVSAGNNPRHVPAHVRDKVFTRDEQQCTYVGADGRRCGSTHVLQIDHIQPVARGGRTRST
jgi:hypothetical protein